MVKKGIFIFLVLLGFSCGSSDDDTQATINLEINECFDAFETNVSICLDSVFNDSRCPTGLVCVWEGDAVAAFTLNHNDNITPFNLHSNSNFQNDTLIDGITIKLLQITPYPIADQQIDPNDYSVEISVDEN